MEESISYSHLDTVRDMRRARTRIYSRVFLLGAGFSKPAGLPLAVELTNLVIQTASKSGRIEKIIEWASRIRDCVAIDDAQANVEELLEACYTLRELYLAQRWVPSSEQWVSMKESEWGAQVDRLLDAVVEVIWDRQCAPSSPTLYADEFVRQLTPHDVVLSFNYDTLVESALTSAGMAWTHTMHEQSPPGRIRVLKAHGSIDWVLLERGEILKFPTTPLWKEDGSGGLAVHRIESRDDLQFVISNRRTNGRRFALAPLGGRKPIGRIPGLGSVWSLAAGHLRLCDELVVVGFSFSPMDLMVRLLLGSERRQRQKPPTLTLIDLRPEAPAN